MEGAEINKSLLALKVKENFFRYINSLKINKPWEGVVVECTHVTHKYIDISDLRRNYSIVIINTCLI